MSFGDVLRLRRPDVLRRLADGDELSAEIHILRCGPIEFKVNQFSDGAAAPAGQVERMVFQEDLLDLAQIGPDPDDRRSWRYGITEKGRRHLARRERAGDSGE